MFHETIKSLFATSVASIASNISQYTINPGKDLTRNRKFPADTMISFLVSEGSSSTKNELLDFFNMDVLAPSDSAFNQQRAKLKPEALEAVFKLFSSSANSLEEKAGYRYLAADGSTFTFFSKPSYATPEYYVDAGHSSKGFYSMHLNAFYDLNRHTYTDALIQPIHNKDEFRAFCDIVDRHEILPGTKNVYIGDRGYCSYNNMAHVIENDQYFSFVQKIFFLKD